MNKLLLVLLLEMTTMTTILCLRKREAELVRVLADKYNIDYQVVVVSQDKIEPEFLPTQPRFTQITTPDNVEKAVIRNSRFVKLGYFLFLEDDQQTEDILNKFDKIMFQKYVWFIKAYDIHNTFDLELEFDMDINILHDTGTGVDIYELYGLQGNTILKRFGRFGNTLFTFESINRLERRTDLMGLTLR